MNKYEKLAKELHQQIADGQFQASLKLPSVRQLCERHDLSMSTVVRALEMLQQDGVIESRDRSGFYIATKLKPSSLEPEASYVLEKPTKIDNKNLVLGLVNSFYDPKVFNLGPAIPSDCFLPVKDVDKATRFAMRNTQYQRDKYQAMPGNKELRLQISRYMHNISCDIDPEQIVITNGCQEAVMMAIISFLKAADTVAVETPTYPGFLQVSELLNLNVIEIPTDPREGLSIGALELASQQWDISCVLMSSNYSNPISARMPTAKKKDLLSLCQRKGIKIIEDDVYGDLSHDPYYRPRPIMSFDDSDTVIYCNSFSKTISPGLRIGWVVNKALYKDLQYSKYVSGLSSVTTSQHTIAEYLKMGKFERHLQSVRRRYKIQTQIMHEKIHQLLPEGTRVTQPKGGFILWLALPNVINTLELLEKTIKRGVCFSPGVLFSASDQQHNCLRINCSMEITEQVENALKILGEEAQNLLIKATQ